MTSSPPLVLAPTSTVGCRDAVGRDRRISVTRYPGHLVVVAPPGGAAELTPEEAMALAAQLNAHARLVKVNAQDAPPLRLSTN